MSSANHSPRPWRPRERVAAVFFVAFILVQVTIPLVQLTQPRPARFGWQMYSTLRPGGWYLTEDASGALDTVRLSDYLSVRRSEVDYHPFLPAYLCQAAPGAVAIVYEQKDSSPERHACP